MSNIFMRFPGGKKKALTLSYDDGVEQDIRLLGIMKENGLKGTFHLNTGCYAKEGTIYEEDTLHRRLSQSQAYELFSSSGMEVAIHGLTHGFLEQLPSNRCIMEIAKDRENLEKQFHTIIRGMSYPYGSYSDEVIECLKRLGIVYARTVKTTGDFSIPQDLYRLMPTCHHNDNRLMELAHNFIEEEPVRASWIFSLWGHSYEFERDMNWEVIETFVKYVGKRHYVWYATNIEIFEYIDAYRKLIFSMDGSIVHNPTDVEIYFEVDNVIYCVESGKTVVAK